MSSCCLCFSIFSFEMLACKLREADKVPEMSPIKLACSALRRNKVYDSLKRISFLLRISFSTSVIMLSDSLYSPSAPLLADSSFSWADYSEDNLCFVAWYFFFAASRRSIFSSRILLMFATAPRLFYSSVAKAES